MTWICFKGAIKEFDFGSTRKILVHHGTFTKMANTKKVLRMLVFPIRKLETSKENEHIEGSKV